MNIIKILLFIFFFVPSVVISQTKEISIFVNSGLVNVKENIGGTFMSRLQLEFNKDEVLEVGYSYANLKYGDKSSFKRHKYSLTFGNNYYSNDNFFSFSSKIGPTLLFFKGTDYKGKAYIGLDLVNSLLLKIWSPFIIEMGLVVGVNTAKSFESGLFVGFKGVVF